MELTKAIITRRSIRKYKNQQVEPSKVKELLYYATQAPSAMNAQPWSFVVIQKREMLQSYSDRAKKLLLGMFDLYPALNRYKPLLSNPDFNIFYNAGTLIAIYAKPETAGYHLDCSLAAQNVMLAAHDMGLGTCWIGFATPFLNQLDTKQELGVSPSLEAVAALVVGYPDGSVPVIVKKEPEVIWLA